VLVLITLGLTEAMQADPLCSNFACRLQIFGDRAIVRADIQVDVLFQFPFL
jgi:hypothetical protein